MQRTQMRRALSRPASAGLAVLGLTVSSFAVLGATAPAAHAVGTINDIVINEVESNGGTPGDWIELYNTNATDSVVLDGAQLSDNDNTHSITITGTIAPHSFAWFQTDNSATSGNFGLGGADSARLFAAGATPGSTTPVDSYSWTNHAATTFGRYPDGAGAKNGSDFFTTTAATQGAANTYTAPVNPSPAAYAGVVINEVESNGDVNGDWIELYNTRSFGSVNLTGAILADNNNGNTYTIGNVSIAAGQYRAFYVDSSFGLGDVDSARFFAAGTQDLATATVISSYSWTTHSPTTYGRVPNGTGSFVITNGGTFAAANTGSSTPPTTLAGNIVINEVESQPGTSPASPGDWVELYNKSGSTQAIAGAVLSDSDNTHAFRIPLTTPALAPGGYAVFQVDDSTVDGSFGLGGADSVRLYEAGSVVGTSTPADQTSWTAHASVTWGRLPNGTGSFGGTSAATPGATN
jgi:hypothetical protein